jgi:surface protein
MNQIMVGEKTPIVLSNCNPWYGTRDNIVFVSSNTDAVIIEGNKAKAVGEGEAQITAINSATQATISNNPATITVTLTDANPGLIMFKANNLNIEREIWIGQINNQEYNARQLSLSDGVYSLNVGAPITQLRVYDSSNISEIVKLNMSSMTCYQEVFWGCTNLEYVDANNWVNENTTQVNHLFTNCTGLKEVDISNWNAENLNYINAFMGCTSLHTIRMDNCNNDTISKVIITEDFPSSNQGTIYCKRANAAGLEAPGNWTFSYID